MDGTYPKASGSAGSKGVKFQIDLLIVFLLNAIRQNIKGWKLSTENKQAGKFDDVVLEFDDGAIVLQAKHKDNKKITSEQLNSTNSKRDDFSLPKYFLDYLVIRSRFSVKLMVICTNTRVDSKILNILNPDNVNEDHILYNENGSLCYTFSDSIISDLLKNAKVYYKNNSKDVDETLITENNAKEFLKHLQFHIGYPSGYDLEKSIEKLLSDLRRFNNLLHDISYRDLHQKIRDWFEQPKGEYLAESRTKALLCEIVTQKFLGSLENYNVLFKNTSLNITNSEKRIFHVVTDGGRLLHLMNIYQNLQHSTAKKLYVGSDYNKDVQKEIIRAFQHPGYTFLIFASPGFSKDSEISEISYMLQQILNSRDYKKIIFVVESNNKLVQRMKSSNNDAYYVYNESLTLDNLLENSQEMLMNKKSVIFQGEEISLANLLPEQITDDHKKLINSQILEKIVIGDKLIVGMRLVDLDEETLKYYVDRSFEGPELTETISEEEICNVDQKFILISDTAGMGKTTVLKNLAIKIKKNNNRLWVVRIELNQCTNILWDCLINKRPINLLELLKYNNPKQETTELEIFLLSLPGTVIVMLDGIDEISPDYTELILDLLYQAKSEKYLKKVFLTTRPHMAIKLEEHLKVTSFKLVPFTERNQIEFLRIYWMGTLKLGCEHIDECIRFAETLTLKLQHWITDWYSDTQFASSPLHAHMLAKVFLENNGSDEWIGVKEYLRTAEELPKLPERMNIGKLYQMFIEKEEDIFLKKGNPYRNIIAHSALKKQFHECLTYHRWLALKTILNDEECSCFTSYEYNNSDDDEKTALKMGMVQKSNNQLMFIHRTFAEYFVAQSILEELQLQNGDIEFQKLFINNILWEKEFEVIRCFLDNFLYNIVPSLKTDNFNIYMSNVVDTDWNYYQRRKEYLHRLSQEGNIEIFRLVLKIIDFEIVTISTSSVDFRSFPEIKTNTLTYLKYITKRDGLEIEDSQHMKLYQEAASGGHTEMLDLFLQMGVDVNSTQGDQGLTTLNCAIDSGLIDTVKFLISRGADVNIKDQDGCAPIIHAIRRDRADIVKLLVSYGADLNSRDQDNNTILHLAASSRSLEIFHLLVTCGMQINNEVNTFGETVLHVAVYDTRDDLMELLVRHNVDVNIANKRGKTALHYAMLNINLSQIEFLVNHGADINAIDGYGHTALFIACVYYKRSINRFEVYRRNACLKIIDVLVKHGATVEGDMPLDVLDLVCNLDIVKLLLENKANNEDDSLRFEAFSYDFDTAKLVLEYQPVINNINVANSQSNKELDCAAFGGNLESIVRLVMENGADVNGTSYGGNKALHFAALGANFDVVEWLVKNGAVVNAANNKGNTALHFVVHIGNFDILNWLLKNGADINFPNNKGETALHFAISRNDFKITESLLENGADTNCLDNSGETVLHFAARRDNFDLIVLLVKNGAGINIPNNHGKTALHFSVRKENFKAVKFLLENGGDLNVATINGHTALHFAVRNTGRVDIVKLVFENGANVNNQNINGETALHCSICTENFEVVEFLVNNGANINIPNNKGETSLHLSIRTNNFEIMELILKNGADFSIKNNKSETALHLSVRRNGVEIVELVVKNCPDINIQNNKGETALHVAAHSYNFQNFELLVKKGANINIPDNEGDTALHIVTRKPRKVYMTELLLETGADISVLNGRGETALHFVVRTCHVGLIKLFLENGTDINVANHNSETIIHLCVSKDNFNIIEFIVKNGWDIDVRALRDHFEIFQLLVKHYPDINIAKNEVNTVLHLASQRNSYNIATLLQKQDDVTLEDASNLYSWEEVVGSASSSSSDYDTDDTDQSSHYDTDDDNYAYERY